MQIITIKKTAFMGLFCAVALLLGYVESLLPVFVAIPGVKLGLANAVIVVVLFLLGDKPAFAINVLRVILSSILFGSMVGFIYSLAGALLSFLVMDLLKRTKRFSVISVSIAGGIFHNVGQILVAMVVLNTVKIGWYFAVLWFFGLLSGALLGVLSALIIKRLGKMHLFEM